MPRKLIRCLDLTVRVPADHLGSLLIEMEGRVEVLGIGVVKEVPFSKNKPKRKVKANKWSAARRKKYKAKRKALLKAKVED